MKRSRKFVVLGGVGVIGRVVVRDLFASHRANRILIADFDAAAARAYARSFRSPRVSAAFADARKPALLARVLRRGTVVVNCTQHEFNLNVMEAALRARVHYVDLGGLFIWTRKQLRWHRRFKNAGLIAILGGGCAPGITNVLARMGADQLDHVDRVRIRVGTVDFRAATDAFYFTYSPQTIIEEMTLPPYVFERGRFIKLKPRSRWERTKFPKPIGPAWTIATRHSEIATIPLSFKAKGIRFCDFHVGFDRSFVAELVRRLKQGWTVRQFAELPAPRGKPDDYEITRVTMEGRKSGRRRVITLDCHAKANAHWSAGAGDIDTGCPPSIIAQMIVDSEIAQPGVWAPERAIPVRPFLRELKKRGLRVVVNVTK